MSGLTAAPPLKWTQCVQPSEEGIAAARENLLEVLAPLGLSKRQRFSIELCVHEALVNALVHGVWDGGGRRILLSCHAEGEQLRLVVEDDGAAFPTDSRRNWSEPAGPGGRGLLLIQAFMSRVWRSFRGNSITMELDLGAER
jgi:anti-sigma regulatory factor (Ser/Thr protein kinase)